MDLGSPLLFVQCEIWKVATAELELAIERRTLPQRFCSVDGSAGGVSY
jgi:hypothetical protein